MTRRGLLLLLASAVGYRPMRQYTMLIDHSHRHRDVSFIFSIKQCDVVAFEAAAREVIAVVKGRS